MDDDGRRWDERYATTTHVEARPPELCERWPHLVSLLPTTGRCLDVASGPGSVSLWLVDRGLDVTALDASAVAVDLLRAAATAEGVADRVDARVVDLDDGLPDELRDLDAIVCQRFRDPSLYAVLVERLRRGGVLFLTVLSTVGCDDPGPFHAPPGELRAAFGDGVGRILHDAEGDGLAHLVVQRI